LRPYARRPQPTSPGSSRRSGAPISPPSSIAGRRSSTRRTSPIAEDGAGERLGFVILAGLKTPGPDIELVRMAVTQPGAGIGKLLLTAAMDLAFNTLSAARLWLDVFDDNARARRIYRVAGFRDEPTPRQAALKADGEPGTLVIMSMSPAQFRGMARP
jgi:diamine N-acetyltransferase